MILTSNTFIRFAVIFRKNSMKSNNRPIPECKDKVPGRNPENERGRDGNGKEQAELRGHTRHHRLHQAVSGDPDAHAHGRVRDVQEQLEHPGEATESSDGS